MSEPVVRFGMGRQMPSGYEAVQLDSGHFLWTDGTRESAIHWDKWAIYRGAWADYRKSLSAPLPQSVVSRSGSHEAGAT